MFHKIVCGGFKEETDRRIELIDEEAEALQKLLLLACGEEGGVSVSGIEEMIELGTIADLYGMEAVVSAIEEAIARSVTVETCAEVLCLNGGGLFLPRAVSAARRAALHMFEDFVQTEGYYQISEELLQDLVGDDAMAAKEEDVLQAVVQWIKAGGGEEGRGERVLGEIRYGLLEASRLAEVWLKAGEILAGPQGTRLRDLADEALRQLPGRGPENEEEHEQPSGRAFRQRKGTDLDWEEYDGGRQQPRSVWDQMNISAICCGEWRVFGGLVDGSIIEWDRSTCDVLQRMRCEGRAGRTWCMMVYSDLLVISGHDDGCLRVWNTATGVCDHVLRGHGDDVFCCSTWDGYLVSGSSDKTIRAWLIGGDTGGPGSWPCLGTVAVHPERVFAVVTWQGRVISGSADGKVRVFGIISRQCEALLETYSDAVRSLCLCKQRLLSSGRHGTVISTGDDGTIGVWSLGTWTNLKRIKLANHISEFQYSTCLGVSGSFVLCGGRCDCGDTGFLMAFDAETMSFVRAMRIDARYVYNLVSMRGEVWGRTGDFGVIVWGKPRQ